MAIDTRIVMLNKRMAKDVLLDMWNGGPRGDVHPMTRVSAKLLDAMEDHLAACARRWMKDTVHSHPALGKTLSV